MALTKRNSPVARYEREIGEIMYNSCFVRTRELYCNASYSSYILASIEEDLGYRFEAIDWLGNIIVSYDVSKGDCEQFKSLLSGYRLLQGEPQCVELLPKYNDDGVEHVSSEYDALHAASRLKDIINPSISDPMVVLEKATGSRSYLDNWSKNCRYQLMTEEEYFDCAPTDNVVLFVIHDSYVLKVIFDIKTKGYKCLFSDIGYLKSTLRVAWESGWSVPDVIYEGYYYSIYDDNGHGSWGVSVLCKKESNYRTLPDIFFGHRVISLKDTFSGCVNLVKPPRIPINAICMTGAFRGCISLEEAPKIPCGMRSMYYAFSGCTSLVKAPEIPESVEEIFGAFEGCTSLKNAPKLPRSAGDWFDLFAGCTSLETAYKPEGNELGLDTAFKDCPNIKFID